MDGELLPHPTSDRSRYSQRVWACVAFALLTVCAGSARADDERKGPGVFLTPQEALALAFPKATITRGTVLLDEEARARVAKLGGTAFDKGLVYPYTAVDEDGKHLGTAWFDTHRVRTQRETLMVVVDADGAVQRIEVLAFCEPKQYLPRAKWYAQYTGRELDARLDLGQDIRGIGGATLSATATNGAVRRVLALHRVAAELERARAEAERKQREREEAARKVREREARERAKRKQGDER
jgi:hypothetical protein